jgi:hypothetical protein
VGTRGKSLGGFQGLLPGSVSKYCLQHSPVPVIVVRPTSKRDKARTKRANDPDRQGYRDILAKSESLIDVNSPRNSFFANDDEALAQAAAAADKQAPDSMHPLAQVAHAGDSSDDQDTNAGTLVDDPRSPGVMMKSPHLQNLDSPDFSDDPSSGEEEDEGGVSTRMSGSRASEVKALALERSQVLIHSMRRGQVRVQDPALPSQTRTIPAEYIKNLGTASLASSYPIF